MNWSCDWIIVEDYVHGRGADFAWRTSLYPGAGAVVYYESCVFVSSGLVTVLARCYPPPTYGTNHSTIYTGPAAPGTIDAPPYPAVRPAPPRPPRFRIRSRSDALGNRG